MAKGDNAFVPTAALRLAVRNDVDVAVLLVTERGRVRGDEDIVFGGAPAHPSGAVRLSEGEDGTAWLDADLTVVEEAVTRVLVVASTEDGALRDVRGLSVEAFGPDGTTVTGYEVTDAGGETAMVLAELYRRAGGWKFRAVGQGYVDGLEGLAVDHGVDVAEGAPETPPRPPEALPEASQVPEALPGASKVPAPRAEDPTTQGPAAIAATAPVPAFVPDWTFGALFEPRLINGTGNDVLVAEDLPPGPVIVEIAVATDGHTAVWTLDRNNKEKDLLVNSTEHNFRGRLLVVVPENGPLRLKLKADGLWQAQVLPLAAARRLTEDTLECWGPDVLLHTGAAADVAFHYRGDSNFIVDSYELAGHDDPTALPRARYPHINEIGRRREALPVPDGPVIVHLGRADGPWRARLKQPSAAVSWLRRARR
ncbi:resistance protein [Streptomyces sp. Root431]|nr:resistance protein [Streptomyces sp. Root431]